MKLAVFALFISSCVFASDYNTALSSVKDAAYIQSGLKDVSQKMETIGRETLKHWNVDREIFILAYSYRCANTKEIKMSLGNGKSVLLQKNYFSYTFSF